MTTDSVTAAHRVCRAALLTLGAQCHVSLIGDPSGGEALATLQPHAVTHRRGGVFCLYEYRMYHSVADDGPCVYATRPAEVAHGTSRFVGPARAACRATFTRTRLRR